MNRIMILVAAATLCAGAGHAQVAGASIRISTEGKSAAQVREDVFQAARKLCQTVSPGYAYRIDEARACIEHSLRDSLAQSSNPGLRVASTR